jgi:hypothetical protein
MIRKANCLINNRNRCHPDYLYGLEVGTALAAYPQN